MYVTTFHCSDKDISRQQLEQLVDLHFNVARLVQEKKIAKTSGTISVFFYQPNIQQDT